MEKIAILIPVYNNQDGLFKTINSLKNSNIQMDIVIVDDGSNSKINVPDKIGKHKIFLIRLEKNQGIEHALNEGLKFILNRGNKYIARIDAGDVVLSERFLKQYIFLESNPNCTLVGSKVEFVDMNGRTVFIQDVPLDDIKIKRKMHLNSCFSHPAVMFRSKVLKEIGCYSYNFKAAEDYEFFFRFTKKYCTANLNEVLTQSELNPFGISISKRRLQLFSRLKIQINNFNPFILESYYGLIKTLLLLIIPNSIVVLIKQLLTKQGLKTYEH